VISCTLDVKASRPGAVMKTPEILIRSGLSAFGSRTTLSTSAYTPTGPLALTTPSHAVIARIGATTAAHGFEISFIASFCKCIYHHVLTSESVNLPPLSPASYHRTALRRVFFHFSQGESVPLK